MAAEREGVSSISLCDAIRYPGVPDGHHEAHEGDAVPDTIQEGDLKAALAAGAAIEDVVVVVRRPPGLGMFFVPYLRLTHPTHQPDPGRWSAVGTWRNRAHGVRSWRNYTTLIEQLAEWGFRDRHTVCFEDDAIMSELVPAPAEPASP